MNPSTALARVLVDELVRCGVSDVVLAPGSRNAPLSVALFQADVAGQLRLHVRFDERTAGFLAVGLARAGGRPAAVVTTSGTAVANLHPALLEAHHDGVAVLVLTADRPPWLRDVGANQVIDQRSVFGSILRLFHEFAVPQSVPGEVAGWRAMVARAVGAAAGAGGVAGPAQLNVPFTEPLLPDPAHESDHWVEAIAGRDGPWTVLRDGAGPLARPGPTGVSAVPAPAPAERVLFVGDLTHPWTERVAGAGHVVVSEAGGAAGRGVLSAGIPLLESGDFLYTAPPERVVVLGRPTLFRAVTRLLADPKLTVDVVAAPATYADPSGSARIVAPGLPDLAARPDPEWAAQWHAADRAAGRAVSEVLDQLDIGHSPRLARDLVGALPDGATLVLGSSQVPRDIGRCAAGRPRLALFANRGVAGIDGTVSTAVGIALARSTGPTVALVGDLTLLHDATGLMIGPAEARPDLAIVVSSNDGGAIFSALETGEPAYADSFERVFGTPHGVSIADLAKSCSADYVRVEDAADLPAAIAQPRGIRIVEVPTSRTELRPVLERMSAAVRRALAHR